MTLYSPANREIGRASARAGDVSIPHDWTALGDRYIDRRHVRQRVAFACQRPRARGNAAYRPPLPWRGEFGGGNHPVGVAT